MTRRQHRSCGGRAAGRWHRRWRRRWQNRRGRRRRCRSRRLAHGRLRGRRRLRCAGSAGYRGSARRWAVLRRGWRHGRRRRHRHAAHHARHRAARTVAGGGRRAGRPLRSGRAAHRRRGQWWLRGRLCRRLHLRHLVRSHRRCWLWRGLVGRHIEDRSLPRRRWPIRRRLHRRRQRWRRPRHGGPGLGRLPGARRWRGLLLLHRRGSGRRVLPDADHRRPSLLRLGRRLRRSVILVGALVGPHLRSGPTDVLGRGLRSLLILPVLALRAL
mmetsp:Transcript_14926/g.44630  ORF Transcript_14926/g.44630 Transcript_14926/m.44630 type:complete len:270 (-) Transcript_14926:857-1666(-)